MEELQQYNFKGQLDGTNRRFTVGHVEDVTVVYNGETLTAGQGYEIVFDQNGNKIVLMDSAPLPDDDLIVLFGTPSAIV